MDEIRFVVNQYLEGCITGEEALNKIVVIATQETHTAEGVNQ